MPVKISGELIGEERVIKQFKSLENINRPLSRAMDKYLQDIEEAVTPYPPATAINSSPGDGHKWYVRNFGWRTVTGKAYRVSEKLSKRWNFYTRTGANGVRGVIENTASYAGYVQGKKQASFHDKRGWKRVDEEVERTIDDLGDMVADEIKRDLR